MNGNRGALMPGGTIASRLAASPGWAMAQQAGRNINALRQGTPLGQTPVQAYQQHIADRALQRQRELLAQDLERRQNPFSERDAAVARGWIDESVTPWEYEAMKRGQTPTKRETAKDASGILRYMDTGEQVFAGDVAEEERDMKKDAGGFLRYVDTGERVFPEAVAETDALENFEEVAKLRKEFRTETGVFREQQRAFGRVLASAREPSAAGDMALVFNFMKVLDPGSTVREGEYASAQNAAGVPERIRNIWNKMVDGEILGEDQRKDFVRRSSMLYEEAAKGYEETAEDYRSLAEQYEFDPSRVVMRGIQYAPESYRDLTGDPLAGTGITRE